MSTIDWHSRQPGTLLLSRPRRGARPTLQEDSVQQFAQWWRQHTDARRQRRQLQQQRAATLAERRAAARTRGAISTSVPADTPPGLTTAEAAAALSVEPGRIAQMIRSGHLRASKVNQRWWIDPESLNDHAHARDQWLTLTGAAQHLNCTTSRIRQAADQGLIRRRPSHQALPSYHRSDVEALRPVVEAEATARERERAARDRGRKRHAAYHSPPDDRRTWITPTQAAGYLRLSPSRVHQLIDEQRLPSTRLPNGRVWLQEPHVLQRLSARSFAEIAAAADRRTAMCSPRRRD
ncbi:helix-turn-helix domain-containing protein [Nocardioides zeae]|uniref:Helix-turn-helix domain-containing protein n=1 Tax=Nocardioides imazamoxiresistens TaxID=3231893 RepID=A0ABU3PQT8_9ACTN|nr:helix-turn-helix domain-containing protein [Nocardioides zeae]MDT9591589.1 helix-turn-helix domain-containing protein [Nocardioides zeae]